MSIKQLTKNFTSDEFCVSVDFPALASNLMFTITDAEFDKLFYLCTFLLQPARNEFPDTPFIVTRGFVDKELNYLQGGEELSRHLDAIACDIITINKGKLFEIYSFMKRYLKAWIGELILYVDENNVPIYLHIALPKWRRDQNIKKRIKYKEG